MGERDGEDMRRTRVRVLIADDHRLMVAALEAALSHDERVEVVGATHRATEVLPLVHSRRPDVVILDVRMPQLDGLTCLDRIRRRHFGVKVVILSGLAVEEIVPAAEEHGAAAVIGKRVDPALLSEIVLRVAAGEAVAPLGFPEPEPTGDGVYSLTQRELSILAALAEGRGNVEIARQLYIAEQTVKFHLTHVYRKLGVRNRTAAVRIALEHGLVESPFASVGAA
jgi:DNA-binding NarL/FixJ family response regulator